VGGDLHEVIAAQPVVVVEMRRDAELQRAQTASAVQAQTPQYRGRIGKAEFLA
jgi:hypothetical protein